MSKIRLIDAAAQRNLSVNRRANGRTPRAVWRYALLFRQLGVFAIVTPFL